MDTPTKEDAYTSKNGYIHWKINGVWKTAHRWTMELHLGRELLPGERVHFRDRDRTNVNLDNLVLKQPGQGSKQGRLLHLSKVFTETWKEMYELDSEQAGQLAKDLLHETLRWFNPTEEEAPEWMKDK